MRFSDLLLVAAVLVAVQAAPITVGPKAATVNRGPNECFKQAGEWVCPWMLTDAEATGIKPEAATINRGPNECFKQAGEWVCPWMLADGAESEVVAVEAEDSAPTGYKCTKDNGVWECTGYGRILSDNLDQGASPTRLPCRWIGKELYCDGVKK
ncbi:hypothetical protein EC991_010594 [Linnemannia zychae]|nr:hypothetical protein EC991_010594 [Linnemannia zychae]